MENEKLDRWITVQRATISRDAFNEPIQIWGDLATVPAAKEDVRDAERVAAQEVGADITTRFRVRWSEVMATVNPKDRIVCEGFTYNVTGAKEIQRRRGIELTAVARND